MKSPIESAKIPEYEIVEEPLGDPIVRPQETPINPHVTQFTLNRRKSVK
jgi:hypothetical protein